MTDDEEKGFIITRIPLKGNSQKDLLLAFYIYSFQIYSDNLVLHNLYIYSSNLKVVTVAKTAFSYI